VYRDELKHDSTGVLLREAQLGMFLSKKVYIVRNLYPMLYDASIGDTILTTQHRWPIVLDTSWGVQTAYDELLLNTNIDELVQYRLKQPYRFKYGMNQRLETI
jgi:hypothetical protein